jgi:hypothetical protein
VVSGQWSPAAPASRHLSHSPPASTPACLTIHVVLNFVRTRTATSSFDQRTHHHSAPVATTRYQFTAVCCRMCRDSATLTLVRDHPTSAKWPKYTTERAPVTVLEDVIPLRQCVTQPLPSDLRLNNERKAAKRLPRKLDRVYVSA